MITTLTPKTATEIFHRLTNNEKTLILRGQSAPGIIEHMAHSLKYEMAYSIPGKDRVDYYEASKAADVTATAMQIMKELAQLVNEEFRIASLKPGF